MSWYQKLIRTDTDNKIPQHISLIFVDEAVHLQFCHCHVSIDVHRLYLKENRARKQNTFEENGPLNNFPPLGCRFNNQ